MRCGSGLFALLVAVVVTAGGLAGCGSRGGAPDQASTGRTTNEAAAPQTGAVKLTAPAADRRLRATRDAADGRLRVTVDIRGTAIRSQTLRVQLSCPDRSCSRFVLTDGDGTFTVRLRPVLPGGRRRLTIGVDYATTPDPRTAASVEVGVRLPRARASRRRPSGGSAPRQTMTVPAAPQATVPPEPMPSQPEAGQGVPAGERRTMTVIGDSLAVGMKPYLGAALPGWTVTVDGRVGRPLDEGMGLVRSAALPPAASSVLAISLFTNDDPHGTSRLSAAVDESLRKVGADGCVIWATIAREPVGGVSYAAANALLARKARSTPRLRIVDWAGYVAAHPGTLSAGNVHPGPGGYQARAALYAEAAGDCP
jgi:hypothetical protein